MACATWSRLNTSISGKAALSVRIASSQNKMSFVSLHHLDIILQNKLAGLGSRNQIKGASLSWTRTDTDIEIETATVESAVQRSANGML